MQMSRINRLVHNQRTRSPVPDLGHLPIDRRPHQQPKMRESSLVSNFKTNANKAVSGAVMAIWPDTTKRGRLLILWVGCPLVMSSVLTASTALQLCLLPSRRGRGGAVMYATQLAPSPVWPVIPAAQ